MCHLSFLIVVFITFSDSEAQLVPSIIGDTIRYELSIDEIAVNFSGRKRKAMAINSVIPGPTLRFKEGQFAIIYVKNNMDVETSIHWHGILLPNFQDGVPYLNSPPIMPGTIHRFEFPLKHSGTYWYHAHTGLQEQRGIYGSIIIEPKDEKLEYDHDLVLVLSDWTDENPDEVLRTLKRGSEWYAIKKGNVQSLDRVIAKGAFGAQLKMWAKRMPGMDISDVYYEAFLINGKPLQEYPQFNAHEKVRLRIINAAASTYFWLTFGGGAAQLVSADGLDVMPVQANKVLHAIGETYDFIVTIPEDKAVEVRATAQDGSGYVKAILGEGEIAEAMEVPKPDLIEMMKNMADMDMNSMHEEKDEMKMPKTMKGEHGSESMPHDQKMHEKSNMEHGNMQMVTGFSYDILKSSKATEFPEEFPVKQMTLNLTGNMWRYVWSMDGKVLSEVDKILIKRGEIVRVTLVNKTMMHHPMHLHGHFFRVLNQNGAYSPLKHTVDVPPMESITLEFEANEYGDWFFHCHILYHMMSGMARVFSYGDARDTRMREHSIKTLLYEDRHMFVWGEVELASNMVGIDVVSSNTRNQVSLDFEYGWNKNLEATLSYERYLGDFFRLYGGADLENEEENELSNLQVVGRVGVRYLLPFFINADLSVDHKIRPQLGLGTELLLFPRVAISGEWEWENDFGITQDLAADEKWAQEHSWNVALEITINKFIALTGGYNNRFGWGGGLSAEL